MAINARDGVRLTRMSSESLLGGRCRCPRLTIVGLITFGAAVGSFQQFRMRLGVRHGAQDWETLHYRTPVVVRVRAAAFDAQARESGGHRCVTMQASSGLRPLSHSLRGF